MNTECYNGLNGNYEMNCLLNDFQSGLINMIGLIERGHDCEAILGRIKKCNELIDLAIDNTDVMSNTTQVKPRTKEVYEKVDCKEIDFWECAKEYQSKLGIYWKDSKGKYVIQDLEQLVQQYKTGVIYRKVTKPIEWWEEAAEVINDTTLGVSAYCDENGILSIKLDKDVIAFGLGKEKWIEFSKALLSGEGN